MKYSPKLKRVMAELEAIIKREDIAAVVVLHTPGFAEFKIMHRPTYSCVEIGDTGPGLIQFKAAKKHFNGDEEKRQYTVAATTNMLHSFAVVTGKVALALMNADEIATKHFGADHTGGGFSSISEQDN